MNDIQRPFTIMGGSKVSKIEIIENLLNKVDNLIITSNRYCLPFPLKIT